MIQLAAPTALRGQCHREEIPGAGRKCCLLFAQQPAQLLQHGKGRQRAEQKSTRFVGKTRKSVSNKSPPGLAPKRKAWGGSWRELEVPLLRGRRKRYSGRTAGHSSPSLPPAAMSLFPTRSLARTLLGRWCVQDRVESGHDAMQWKGGPRSWAVDNGHTRTGWVRGSL